MGSQAVFTRGTRGGFTAVLGKPAEAGQGPPRKLSDPEIELTMSSESEPVLNVWREVFGPVSAFNECHATSFLVPKLHVRTSPGRRLSVPGGSLV